MALLRRLTLTTTATTLALIGVGGLVRATESGLGCPSWPTCYGRWIPPLESHALIEYSHRFVAAIAVVLICAQGILAWRRRRTARSVFVPSAAAVGLVFAQAALGGVVVGRDLEPSIVTLHFATAMALAGSLVAAAVAAFCLAAGNEDREPPLARGTARLARWTLVGTGAVLLAGAYVRGEEAGLAFRDWPLMGGRVIPPLDRFAAPHFVHRALVFAVGAALIVLVGRVLRDRTRRPAVRAFTLLAAGLFLAQALIGAAQVWTELAAWSRVAHVVLSSLVWSSLAALVATNRQLVACAVRPRRSAPPSREATPILTAEPAPISGGQEIAAAIVPVPLADTLRAYLALTKPRIIVLLLVTTVPTMIIAAQGWPSAWLVAATLVGGTIAAGGANTINCYLDRDIDEVMARTRNRPLPRHRIEPADALRFGIALSAISSAWLWATVNLLSAALALGAILFYVFGYTILLKRSTAQNIVIGGAAGAVPCLVGWAATTGRLDAPAAVLFAIVFFWTPPHFWALALRYAGDYEAAGVPMMPVVRGAAATARQIVAYSVITVGVTLALWPVAGMGALYAAAAAGLGAALLIHALRLWRDASARAALRLFKFSITYLALLFVAMAADRLVLAA